MNGPTGGHYRSGRIWVRGSIASGKGFSLPRPLSRLLPALTMSIPVTIFAVAALSFPLALAQALRLSAPATASWIAAMYGVSAAASVALTLRFRQPLLVAWSISGMALAATFIGHATYAELCGSTLAAGVMIALVGALGLTERVSHWSRRPSSWPWSRAQSSPTSREFSPRCQAHQPW